MGNDEKAGIQIKRACLKEINRLAIDLKKNDSAITALVAALAGLHSMGDDYIGGDEARDTLDQIIRFDLVTGRSVFLRGALLQMVKSTTLHPAGLNTCFSLKKESLHNIQHALRNGAKCYPQEEELHGESEVEALKILAFTGPGELRECGRAEGFCLVLKRWVADETCGALVQFLQSHWTNNVLGPINRRLFDSQTNRLRQNVKIT